LAPVKASKNIVRKSLSYHLQKVSSDKEEPAAFEDVASHLDEASIHFHERSIFNAATSKRATSIQAKPAIHFLNI
jgi:hypothetical protein